jgi:hypothetical protein
MLVSRCMQIAAVRPASTLVNNSMSDGDAEGCESDLVGKYCSLHQRVKADRSSGAVAIAGGRNDLEVGSLTSATVGAGGAADPG